MRPRLPAALLAVVLLPVAQDVWAQSTGTPVFVTPRRNFRTYDWGATLSDPGPGFALEGFYTRTAGANDLRFRAGIHDVDNGATAFLVGVDFRAPIINYSESFPLDGALTAGLGGAFSDDGSVGFIPLGLSLGRRIDVENSSVTFQPYFQPLVAVTFGDNGDDELRFSLGFGVELGFSGDFDLEVSGSVGDYDGIAVSFGILH